MEKTFINIKIVNVDKEKWENFKKNVSADPVIDGGLVPLDADNNLYVDFDVCLNNLPTVAIEALSAMVTCHRATKYYADKKQA